MHELTTKGFSALLIGEGPHAADAAEAIALAGGRVIATIGWNEAGRVLADPAALLVIETRDVADAVLADGLALIDSAGLRLVVSLGADQIDPVMAGLPTARADYLCDPTLAERVSAIAVAAAFAGLPPAAVVRENEAARLERLNEEVARIAEVLARLTARPGQAADSPQRQVEDRRAGYAAQPPADDAIDPAEIRRVIRARRMRDQFLGEGLFEDPAWDMALDLFAAGLERAQVSISSLCIAAAVAPTTALRWIGKMTEAGLLVRHPDPFDRRRVFMALSPSAADGMRRYVAALRRAGLGMV